MDKKNHSKVCPQYVADEVASNFFRFTLLTSGVGCLLVYIRMGHFGVSARFYSDLRRKF